ncbi:MAG: OmpA family protein [Xanthomonadales bacterium]|nr:OmpA family protein [Xanthomonadales bacterium]
MMKGRFLSAALAASVLVAGCTTVDPYTREEKTSNATKGAAIGAGVGVVAGILSGDDSRERRKRALIGAGVGAIAGGSVGYYMDVQEARLRERLERTGVSVTRTGNEIVLNMPSNITFAVDSAEITPDFQSVLDGVTEVLKEYDKTLIEVVGHTDSTGSDRYNQLLSEQRANSVGNYLTRNGIRAVRVATAGYGEQFPIADNGSAAGRQANRRVELTLVPLTS